MRYHSRLQAYINPHRFGPTSAAVADQLDARLRSLLVDRTGGWLHDRLRPEFANHVSSQLRRDLYAIQR